ncbi:MAG: F0F1 ATP synthase subunit A [Gemmatimonadaceae bacterium]|nr:F0F1 ATP synthase subunit A [Gemmatimonadaceae bacterium]
MTVQCGVYGRVSAPLWFFVSLLVRLGLALAVFAWIGRDQPVRLAGALLGFIVARSLVLRMTRTMPLASPTDGHTGEVQRGACVPDMRIFWSSGIVKLNLTIVMTWLVMLADDRWVRHSLRGVYGRMSRFRAGRACSRSSSAPSSGRSSRWASPRRGGTCPSWHDLSLCWRVLAADHLSGYVAPTGSLSTTAALALAVFVAVPVFGIRSRGARGYLNSYLQPTPLMLPFNIIGELSRTLALAIRLFGNVMSGTMIIGILLTITPFLFPVVMTLFGLLTGVIQAYIFTVLAAVFIAAATQAVES